MISESDFSDVQDILDGRKRSTTKPKIVSMDTLPLRGFLKCPKCDRMLTGSASKGKMGKYYYYYHCSSSCGTRFRAESANEIFEQQLQDMLPKAGMAELFSEMIVNEYISQGKQQNLERKQILSQIEELNKRIQKALIQKVDGTLDDDDYVFIKKDTHSKIERLEFDLSLLSHRNNEIAKLLKSELSKIGNMGNLYKNGTIEQKRQIISSIFPENLVFDGERHRTHKINSAVSLIFNKTNELKENKKGTNPSFLDLSLQVTRLGLEPRTPTLKVLCSTN